MKIDKAEPEQIPASKDQSDDDDYLYVAAKNIALGIFEQGRTRTNALQLTSRALRFASNIIRQFEAKEPISEPLACTAGCYYCCFYQVLLIPPEALLIGNYIEKAYTDQSKQDLMERIETTLRLTEGKSIQERVRKVCV
jgi:predicted RNase H-like HicB family nuclease